MYINSFFEQASSFLTLAVIVLLTISAVQMLKRISQYLKNALHACVYIYIWQLTVYVPY